MTDWTKPESYNAKTIAWTMLRERLANGPAIGAATIEEMMRAALPTHLVIEPKFSLGDIDPGSFQPPRIRGEWGGRRSGKTERMRNWAIDLARGPDRSATATWSGRRWILD